VSHKHFCRIEASSVRGPINGIEGRPTSFLLQRGKPVSSCSIRRHKPQRARFKSRRCNGYERDKAISIKRELFLCFRLKNSEGPIYANNEVDTGFTGQNAG
jgi:hypothetical protein